MPTQVSDYNNVTVLTVKDDLCGEEVEVFSDRAAGCVRHGQFNLVVDCSAVGGLDSAALEAMLDLQDKCEDELGAVKLCNLNETCKKILEITRLARRFEMFDELDSAVKSFA